MSVEALAEYKNPRYGTGKAGSGRPFKGNVKMNR